MEVMISIQDGTAGSTDRLSLNLNGQTIKEVKTSLMENERLLKTSKIEK